MKVISIREQPDFKDIAIAYLQRSWPSVWPVIYEDCITHCIDAKNDLPQWYLLEMEEKIIGCAGLITNDFISRGDLYPWICAIFIDPDHRGNNYAAMLIEKAKEDTVKAGYEYLYLSSEHVGYYEKLGFEYIGQGYHPWRAESRIYQIKIS